MCEAEIWLQHGSFVVDGNAYFFTAADVVHRLESSFGKKAIVVGVGYPITDNVYDPRRSADLTPPTKDQEHRHPIGRDGQPMKDITLGEAQGFLKVLADTVMPLVEEMFPTLPLKHWPKALFGHSYGGLFTLFSLFTKTDLFSTYIAASPSIWFNDCSIVHEQEKAFLRGTRRFSDPEVISSWEESAVSNPRLFMMFGSLEQDAVQKPGESDEDFERRKQGALERRMRDNALEMGARLQASERLSQVWLWEFEGEDHGGASVCGLQRGIVKLLEASD